MENNKSVNFDDEIKLKQQIVSGMVILGFRRIFLQIILTGSNIILARVLLPADFGLFAIISFVVLNMGLLTNLGLAQALIQKNASLDRYQALTLITTVICTSCCCILIVYLLAPVFNSFYGGKLGSSGIYWLRLYSVALIFLNIQALAFAQLEKKLDYYKLTITEVITLLVTQLSVIFLALKNFGMSSLVIGNLLGTGIGSVTGLLLSRYPLGLRFKFAELKPLLPFGINYQLGTLAGMINGSVVPLFVGVATGPQSVGFINMAAGIRQAGLSPVETIGKLTFSGTAKIQHEKKILGRLIERMIQLAVLFSFPLLAILFAVAPEFIGFVLTAQWMPMLPTLYLSLIQGFFLLPGTLLIQLLLALGFSRYVRNLSLFWAILQWVFTVPLVFLYGFNGFVIAGILVSATFFIPLKKMQTVVEFRFWTLIAGYFLAAVGSGVVTYYLKQILPIVSLANLVFLSLCGLLSYSVIIYSMYGVAVLRDIQSFIRLLKKS